MNSLCFIFLKIGIRGLLRKLGVSVVHSPEVPRFSSLVPCEAGGGAGGRKKGKGKD